MNPFSISAPSSNLGAMISVGEGEPACSGKSIALRLAQPRGAIRTNTERSINGIECITRSSTVAWGLSEINGQVGPTAGMLTLLTSLTLLTGFGVDVV
jgi:hypothetical protein